MTSTVWFLKQNKNTVTIYKSMCYIYIYIYIIYIYPELVHSNV